MLYSSFNGLKISRIGLGTVQFGLDYGYTKLINQRKVDEILTACVENGVNYLDTARTYGDSEKKIGRFLKKHREAKFIVATKLARFAPRDIADSRRCRRVVEKSIAASLKVLKRDCLDILQLHQADGFLIKHQALWTVLRRMKEKGLFRYFGVSLYTPEEATQALSHGEPLIDFIQAPFNIFDQRFLPLLDYFKKKKVGFVARSIFLKGIIPAPLKKLPRSLRGLTRAKTTLFALSQKTRIPLNLLAVLFVLGGRNNRRISTMILGVDSAKELRDNLRVMEPEVQRAYSAIAGRMGEFKIQESRLIDPRHWEDF